MIYLTLFIEFFKVGLFSFGGGFGMIPLIQDAVIRHNWMSEDAFYNFIGVCESTPGPIAVNMATYVGSTQAGLPGGIVATLGVITPSFFIILLIAAVIKNLTKNTYVQGFLYGIKPVILALILATGISMMKTLDRKKIPVLVFVVTFIIMVIGELLSKSVNAILLILAGGIIGIFCTSFKRIRKEDADK